MVKEIEKDNQKYYECKYKFVYRDKKWAKKCESWYKRYKSYNLNIIGHAINCKLKGSK